MGSDIQVLVWVVFLSCCLSLTKSSTTAPSPIDFCSLTCTDVYTDTTHDNSGCDCSQSSACGSNLVVLAPTDEERELIINTHNGLREKVANGTEQRGQNKGGAADMNALAYDHNVEYIAECWAKKCVPAHDHCRRTDKFKTIGQNIYTSIGQDCDSKIFTKAIETWFDEISGMTLGCVLGYGSCMSVGHYTQLVWAKTTHVGCARVELPGKTCHVFCNYGPSGNIAGEALYTIGPGGSGCSALDKNYRSLCASKRINARATAPNVRAFAAFTFIFATISPRLFK